MVSHMVVFVFNPMFENGMVSHMVVFVFNLIYEKHV